MKLAIFGGTGRTGRLLVAQALAAGHEVTALARNPARLPIDHKQLRVIRGDVKDQVKVEEVVKNSEAVLSVLGPSTNKPVYQISQGIENILTAMETHGVRRIIQSVGAGVVDPKDKPTLFGKFIGFLVRNVSRYVYEDMKRVSDLLRASDLDWTIVRVPMLVNGESTGELKVGYMGRGVGPRIVRGDVAAFILKQLDGESYLRQSPAISN